MVKIILLVAIVTLAFVNGQNFPFPAFQAGGPLNNLFKNLKLPLSPEEIINRQPSPNQNFHASYSSSQSFGDGKMRTSVIHNNNGQKKEWTWTN